MGKIKGWKKTGNITDLDTKEETYYQESPKLQSLSITKWGKKTLHFPNTTIFIYDKRGKETFRKMFNEYKSAKDYAIKFMSQQLKKFVVVEYFDGEGDDEPSYEKTIVKAKTKVEARDIIWNSDEHSGEIVDVYEVRK